jgi:hypothetical protein
MNEIFDEALETKKFQMYAEKADTVEKRIDLCEKYLRAKKKQMGQVEHLTFQDTKGIHRLYARSIISDELAYSGSKSEIESVVQRQLVDEIIREMIKNEYISFDTERRLYQSDTIFSARTFVWKDPSGK